MNEKQGLFQLVSYYVLIDHHGNGVEEAHPSYLLEKLWMLESTEERCFCVLDDSNQRRVLAWCKKWGVEIPSNILKYMEQKEIALGRR